MKRPPSKPIRVEEQLLPLLRSKFKKQSIVFGSLRNKANPVRECVLVADPQGKATLVSQYVRVRMSVIVRRSDGSGDFAAAQDLSSEIIHTLTSTDVGGRFISLELDSGPVRQEDNGIIFAYTVFLVQISTV